jgi:hypothetical protein
LLGAALDVSRSVEADGPIIVHDDAMLEVPAHRTREDRLFQISALAHEVGDGVLVSAAGDILLDDRTLIERLAEKLA